MTDVPSYNDPFDVLYRMVEEDLAQGKDPYESLVDLGMLGGCIPAEGNGRSANARKLQQLLRNAPQRLVDTALTSAVREGYWLLNSTVAGSLSLRSIDYGQERMLGFIWCLEALHDKPAREITHPKCRVIVNCMMNFSSLAIEMLARQSHNEDDDFFEGAD